MKRCNFCKRRMFHYKSLFAKVIKNRMDCGGDCFKCMKKIEEDMREDDD